MSNVHAVGRLVFFCCIVFVLAGAAPSPSFAEKSQGTPVENSLQDAASRQEVEAIVARLSDSEIRELVISQFDRNMPDAARQQKAPSGLSVRLQKWLHALDENAGAADGGGTRLLPFVLRVPGEMGRSFLQLGDGSLLHSLVNLLPIILAFAFGGAAEWFSRRLLTKSLAGQPAAMTSVKGEGRFWAALVALLPSVVHLTVFAFSAVLFFLLFVNGAATARVTFMALLGTVVGGRGVSLVSVLLCRPDNASLRLLPMGDQLAAKVDQGFRFFVWYTAAGLMLLGFFASTGMGKDSRLALGAILGTVLLLLIAIKIVMIRESVAGEIRATQDGREPSWAVKQFASMWHVFALLYLFGIWGVWINTILTGTGHDNGALIISLLIIPLFLILDRIGSWLVGTIAATLEMHEDAAAEEQKREKLGEAYVSPEEKQRRMKTFLMRAFRAFIALTLLVWILALWGVDFPLAGNIVKAAFDILITLALALFFWRYISMFIERKIQESLPDKEEEDTDDGGEFGPTQQLGRSYTLLPMIRRFIATTLMVMVSLIVLSAIGVDIGPLLAGAGVIGLAIGFGAQKLVSDVLSGIFYLLDDAFRVGEYIQAGSVMGTVENITLRNVMLRHHRGMLQIIPHSELGSITNFMRGGIVVKFNLEFPYDTDVELVRKIIKKVGLAMLEDEELGPDFIRPVKSQGVYEITNSVMVIRVKFTAKPGRQFLIRREAFRRITDALAAKGVHYAHRKVIVEVPQAEGQQLSEEQMRAAVEAGAAAGRVTLDKTSQEDRQPPENEQF